MKPGVLFIGHGTRMDSGICEFRSFVEKASERLREYLHWKETDGWIGESFLELKPPTILDAIEEAVRDGYKQILAVPIFLFSARHIKSDIPRFLTQAKSRHPQLSLQCLPPIGCSQPLIEAAIGRLYESGYRETMRPTCVIFVCRGGTDEEARKEFLNLVRCVKARLAVLAPRTKAAYLAGMGPRLHEVLEEASDEGYETIYVLPLLLFHGRLVLQLHEEIQEWNRNFLYHKMRVILANHLGNHPFLLDVIAETAAVMIGKGSMLQ